MWFIQIEFVRKKEKTLGKKDKSILSAF